MMDSSAAGATTDSNIEVKAEPGSDCFHIKEESETGTLESGSDAADLTKTDHVQIKEEPIDLYDAEFAHNETHVKPEEEVPREEGTLETPVTIKCESQDYLKDENEYSPDFDGDEETYQDFLDDSVGPSDPGRTATGEYSCFHCGLPYHKKLLLAAHVKLHLTGDIEGVLATKKHLCPHCDFRSHNRYLMTRHLLTHSKPLRCQNCPFITHDRETLMHHKSKHEGVVYTCRECPFSTPNLGTLTTHRHKKHSRQTVQCHFCCYTGVAYLVRRHENSCHSGAMYSCAQCPLKFPRRVDWRRHTYSEHVSLLQCYYCDFKVNQAYSGNFRRHVQTHMKTHKCPSCSSTFASYKDLKLHLRSNHSASQKRRRDLVFFRMDQL